MQDFLMNNRSIANAIDSPIDTCQYAPKKLIDMPITQQQKPKGPNTEGAQNIVKLRCILFQILTPLKINHHHRASLDSAVNLMLTEFCKEMASF